MARRKPIRFKGYDWTELLQLQYVAGNKWPKPPKKLEVEPLMSREDAVSAYLINTYLGDLIMSDTRKAERRVAANYVRKFCTALGRCKHDYSSPVYAAMAKIEDDDTLLQWVCRNLECMWN